MDPTNKSNVLFNNSDINENQEDIWDDRALIRAYDRSVKQVKDKLSGKNISSAKIIEQYRGDDNDEEEEESEYDEDDQDEVNSNEGDQDELSLKTKQNPKDWKVGDLCMSVYSQDGLVYPANIIKIDDQNCTVRYLHYLNEEEKSLSELFESAKEQEENDDQEIKNEKKTTPSFLPPPPLPMPSIPNVNSQVTGEDDALHSMLISWYMSGYHTGYYYGLKNAASKDKKK
jgi:survival motor neuron protein